MIATDPDKFCPFHSPHWYWVRAAWYEHMWERVYGPVGYLALVTLPAMTTVDGFK